MNYRQRFLESYASTHGSSAEAPPRAEDLWRDYEFFYGAALPRDPEARILEVGCGDGGLLEFLEKKKGRRQVFGIDANPEQVARARGRGASHVETAEAKDYLSARKEDFDLLFALDVLEHMTKDEALLFLDLARAALKSGGTLVLRTVNGASPFAGRILYGDFTHESAYTQGSLTQLLRVAGFEDPRFVEACPPSLRRGPRGWLRYALWRAAEQAIKLYMHATTGSGVLRSGHIWTEEIIAFARRP